METSAPEEKRLSTRQLLIKIPGVPCLYRHTINGGYYAAKKVLGKRKEHSLGTTDRKIAERELKKWIENLDKVDSTAERTTLSELLGKFQEVRKGLSKSTVATETGMINKLKRTWKHGLSLRVGQIKPSMLDEWMAQQESELKNSSFNRYTLFLKQLFDLAVADKMIAESPFDGMQRTWKRPQKVLRNIPTVEQHDAIVNDIRSQRFNVEAEESADFIDCIGKAGLGQAEVSSLTLGAIEWDKNRLCIRRRKTGELFYVPIFPFLRPLLEKLCKQFPENAPRDQKLFSIKSARKSLTHACDRLGYLKFTQRNIRQCLIRRLWQKRVDYKFIAKWQTAERLGITDPKQKAKLGAMTREEKIDNVLMSDFEGFWWANPLPGEEAAFRDVQERLNRSRAREMSAQLASEPEGERATKAVCLDEQGGLGGTNVGNDGLGASAVRRKEDFDLSRGGRYRDKGRALRAPQSLIDQD